MAEKNIYSRIQQKHDVESNWAKATGFIPLSGEIIIYDVDASNSKPRFKVGDGSTNINDLPFKESENYVITSTEPEDKTVLWIDPSEEDNNLILIDTTLTNSGQAADAKIVGEALGEKLSADAQINGGTW